MSNARYLSILDEIKFQSKDWTDYLKYEDFKTHCYELICEKCILAYQKGKVGIDDIEYTGEVIGDE